MICEEKCSFVVTRLGKRDQSAVSSVNSAAAADRFETRTEGGFFQLLGFCV